MNSLQTIVDLLIQPGKGILAADESNATIGKRFATINVANTEENRRAYRELLSNTPNLEKYISGVILFHETLTQTASNGVAIIENFQAKGIIPGIKVDQGLIPLLPTNDKEQATAGIDSLATKLLQYKELGVGFAKWRNIFTIDVKNNLPSDYAIIHNAQSLARYAKICQELDIVPIVEPEVLMDGSHTIADCKRVTKKVLAQVFTELRNHNVDLRYIILKPNMVVPGKDNKENITPETIAINTLEVLRDEVPASVPSINFLSGGISSELATTYLHLLNQLGQAPWRLSFSFGRALQAECLTKWSGKTTNISSAQEALLHVAQNNGTVVL